MKLKLLFAAATTMAARLGSVKTEQPDLTLRIHFCNAGVCGGKESDTADRAGAGEKKRGENLQTKLRPLITKTRPLVEPGRLISEANI